MTGAPASNLATLLDTFKVLVRLPNLRLNLLVRFAATNPAAVGIRRSRQQEPPATLEFCPDVGHALGVQTVAAGLLGLGGWVRGRARLIDVLDSHPALGTGVALSDLEAVDAAGGLTVVIAIVGTGPKAARWQA